MKLLTISLLTISQLIMSQPTPPTIRLAWKEIFIEQSEILYQSNDITKENFAKDWDIKSGEWKVENGWLTGKNPENAPGMIVSKGDYFGNVMIEFEARNVLPSTHDIDVMWNGTWDEKLNKRGIAYVAGVQGWWEGKVGIEKSPEYKFLSATQIFKYEPGKTYKIIAGSVDGHCFIVVDGKIVLETTDLDPIDVTKYGRVGFEAYASWIQVKNIKVRKINWKPLNLRYEKQF